MYAQNSVQQREQMSISADIANRWWCIRIWKNLVKQ